MNIRLNNARFTRPARLRPVTRGRLNGAIATRLHTAEYFAQPSWVLPTKGI